jgi:2-polyprenyl-3-methyl-5-hydroxy-6-metoxy-1,4-benzoquinol methylase
VDGRVEGLARRLPAPIRRPLGALRARWQAYRRGRRRSVENVARVNTREAFEAVYGEQALREEYLSPERLEFYGEVASICAELAPRRLIDVGCGTGHLLAEVLSRVPEAEAVGVDYAANAIAQLAEVAPAARGVHASLFDLHEEPHAYDLVLCTEVLEHVERPEEALEVLVRLCAPGGHVVATVPDGEQDSYEGHVSFWSEAEFARFLSAAGDAGVRRARSGDLIGVISR